MCVCVLSFRFSNQCAEERKKMEKMIAVDDLGKDEHSAEDRLRLKLAAMYRLVDSKGWGQNIYNHITVS